MSVKRLESLGDPDAIPQAIFWRPLHYFTMAYRTDHDDLDVFKAAAFCIGNHVRFDLRTYAGHPDYTVTLYLPAIFVELGEIANAIRLAVERMAVPGSALAWRRGLEFEYGALSRRTEDRIREPEARVLALKIASMCPRRTASTEYIKEQVPNYVQLSRRDLVLSRTRKNERLWQQIVGNVISHMSTPKGPFEMGYARRTKNGLTVTSRGVDYLKSIGFS